MIDLSEEDMNRLLGDIRALASSDRIVNHRGHPVPFPMRSTVLSFSDWDRRELEARLKVTLPPDLVGIWNKTSGLRLFEDFTYGQWGLALWGPQETLRRNTRDAMEIAYREGDFRTGDLLVGKFLGDSDLLVMRCDGDANDFGSLLVALPIDPREAWPRVGRSLSEFLSNFLASSGDKFWEQSSLG